MTADVPTAAPPNNNVVVNQFNQPLVPPMTALPGSAEGSFAHSLKSLFSGMARTTEPLTPAGVLSDLRQVSLPESPFEFEADDVRPLVDKPAVRRA